MGKANNEKRPRLQYRPTFAQYIAFRRCRYNPSMQRFETLDPTLQADRNERTSTTKRFRSGSSRAEGLHERTSYL